MRRQLVDHWTAALTVLQQLRPAASVRPANGWELFRFGTGNDASIVEFDFGPAVFNVPERAASIGVDLFVAVDGRLAFRRDRFVAERRLVTHSFGTRAAYFRKKPSGSEHIYGAHYDFSLDELGHPVFHSQMRSFVEMWNTVEENYCAGIVGDDRVRGILQAVRIPTAQMDVFSFFLQICADHLMCPDSGCDERTAFNGLVESSSLIQGAGNQATRLASESANSCYRACHWYPIVP